MKPFLTCGLCFLFLSFFAPGAEAQGGGRGWLERLSGPGPFEGNEFFLSFCFAPKAGADANDETQRVALKDPWSSDCSDPQKRRGSLTIGYARLTSQDNSLEYPAEVTAEEKEVVLQQISPSLELRVQRTLDVGVGFSLNWFTGELFDTFLRGSIDPIRIRWRPLTLLGESHKTRWFQVTAKATYFLGKFTASDFGAGGSFRETNEVVWGLGIVADGAELIRALRERP